MYHPTSQLPVEDLLKGLHNEVSKGFININTCKETGLQLFCYSKAAVFSKEWNEFTRMARGLIICPKTQTIVARPFEKFFNYGEIISTTDGVSQFTEKFEVFEKIYGSLIVLFYYDGKWRTTTKGSFTSTQAEWASKQVSYMDTNALVKGDTYLLEATYPENKIVVPYTDERLTMLAAYGEDGKEYTHTDLRYTATEAGFPCVAKYDFSNLHDLVEHTRQLPFTQEGFVIRFENGYRIKLKGDEYCRLHRAISNLTPLVVWEHMLNGDDLQVCKAELPEEFWRDFESIVYLLNQKTYAFIQKVLAVAEEYKDVATRDLAAAYTGKKVYRDLLFAFRKAKDVPDFMKLVRGKNNEILPSSRKVIFELVKPRANVLEGYQPSTAINHFEEESL